MQLKFWKKDDPRLKRPTPPKYAPTVSTKDVIFFLRLLFKWQGAVWKLLWLDLVVFILLYAVVNVSYHFFLNDGLHEPQRLIFVNFVKHVRQIAQNVPLSFLLGFFVSSVLSRWWSVCMTIPWMSQPAILLQSYVAPQNKKKLARRIRMNILRYMNLAWILAMKNQSLQIFTRFQLPGDTKSDFQMLRRTFENLFINRFFAKKVIPDRSKGVSDLQDRMKMINNDLHVKKNFGLLITEKEIEIFANIAKTAETPNYHGDYWIPLQWCTRILVKAKQAAIFQGSHEFTQLISLVDRVRGGLGTLSLYSDINIPLVYIQVIIIAVYSFFLGEVFSSQLIRYRPVMVSRANATMEFNQFGNYVPVFSIFKFLFFMGWFKTAASLINPLGNDAHDLPTSSMLDYNLMISVASGDANDDIYPDMLTYEGDPMEQLEKLPKPLNLENIIEAFEMEENPRKNAEEVRLTEEAC